MRIRKTLIAVCVPIAIVLINMGQVFSQEDLSSEIKDEELEQEFKWLMAETFVITASKVMEDIKKSAASITVITDKQIRQMGARHLTDVLRVVPGFGSSRWINGTSLFAVRGGVRSWSNSVLAMINSHPINNVEDGGATWVHDTLIIDNIKRIEFIRGPGSALYGANAYHGVINIITKEAEAIDGFELTARGGSWDTQQYNMLFGKTFSELEVAVNLNYFKTHGYRAFIEEDLQTQLDQYWGAFGFPPASLAPARTNGDDEKYDVAVNLKYKGFMFDGRYVDREPEMPFGLYPVLNEGSSYPLEDYYLNLSYETYILEGVDISGKLYRNHLDGLIDLQGFPPGFTAMTPTGIATWDEGILLRRSSKIRRNGIEIQATYSINDSNTIVAGATYEKHKWYDANAWINFIPINFPFVVEKLLSVQKFPLDTQKRDLKALFFEDIWDITDDIRMTTGVRYDHYSDFGSHLSPRIGLTWEYLKGYDLKLLYGHAFRAPTFEEIATNPELDPETIDTYEVSLGADFTSSFSGRITLFHREEKDIIWVNETGMGYVNQGKSRDQGFEVEAKYDFGKGTYISGRYEYLSVKSGPIYSYYHAYLMANVRLSRYLNFNADCIYLDSMSRIDPGDPRDDPSSLTLVNATLIAKKFLKRHEGLELRGSVYNLLDKDWSTPVAGAPSPIPNDWPIPGINYLLEIKYIF